MTDQLVKDNERIDDLQNGYYVIQDPDKFCFGMDAVLLSGFAKVKKGETALDLGTGTGIIPILLKTKTNGKHFTGLEIQKECADMAGRNLIVVNAVEAEPYASSAWAGRKGGRAPSSGPGRKGRISRPPSIAMPPAPT